MAVLLSPVGGVAAQFFTNAGVPLSGGKIYTYAAGTSTPQATYTTGAGNIQHSNPIVLDAAGRVPTGEIWLTDGLSYKFVLKDANDVLIATYNNIVGINSNFVNFVNQQEIQTATAGQTVFTLTTMQYQPGTGNLSVFVDGVNQYGPGAQYAYTETSSTVVTFVSGLHVGAEVKFTSSQIQNAGAIDASQVSYYDTFNSQTTSVETALQEHIRGNTGKQQFAIGAIPRCTAGVFSLLDDSGHAPLNVSSVTQPDAFNIRINYAKTASKINTFVVGADDALAPYGLICGGDVGSNYANILAFAPLNCFFDGNSVSPNLVTTPLWASSITASKISTSTVRITHPAALNNDAPVVSLVVNELQRIPAVSFGATTVDVTMYGDAEGFVAFNGASWEQSNSDNLVSPVIEWNISDNVLRITHNIADPIGLTKRVPLIAGHGGIYIPQIYNVGGDWFEIAFYDFAGTKINTPNTDMKIWYRRDFLVPCVWNDATIVTLRRGFCAVPSANFSNVSGNNIWITGTMEY